MRGSSRRCPSSSSTSRSAARRRPSRRRRACARRCRRRRDASPTAGASWCARAGPSRSCASWPRRRPASRGARHASRSPPPSGRRRDHMARPIDTERLLPPAACAELDRYPLTESEAAPHRGGPLGALAGWYWCGAGGGLLALALHEETGLPLVAMLSALETADDDLPLELVLEA